MPTKKLIVLVGPTAVGKTDVAIRLAMELQTDIISADSRQIYKELNIGTAKPSDEALAAVRHHFVGTLSIHDDYAAGQFGRDVLSLLEDLFKKHETVILSGGSGLYIKAVCEGFDELPEVATGIREALTTEYEEKGLAWLQQELEEADPDYFLTVDQRNPQRLIRALELHRATGKLQGDLRRNQKQNRPFAIVKIGLDLDRDELYQRIGQRMDDMIAAGLFDEAKSFYPLKDLNALQTVGYREIFGFLDGTYDREEAIRLLKRNSRHYAKRQLTWFRKDPAIKWFNPGHFQEILTFAETSV